MTQRALDAGATGDATPPGATSPDATQSKGAEHEDLAAIVREVVQEENNGIWAAMRNQLTPIQQRMGDLDSMAQTIIGLEAGGKQTRALLQALAEGSLSEEQVQAITTASDQEQKQSQTEAENARLKAQLEAQEKQREGSSMTAEQVMQHEWREYIAPQVERIAKAEGLTFDELRALMPNTMRPGATSKDWQRMLDATEAIAKTEGDKRHKRAQPRVEAAGVRPAGGAADPPRTNMERLQRAWAKKLGDA